MTSLPTSVGVVGAGRLGTTLARALRSIDINVTGPVVRTETCEAELILLCVPDAAITQVAGEYAGRGERIGHLSGATPLSALAAAGVPALGMHPLQTFQLTDGPERFHGVGCAVAGTDEDSRSTAQQLATALGMTPFPIAEADRAAYHASACLMSNYLLTVAAAAERLAAVAGIPAEQMRTLFAPLAETTLTNWRVLGPDKALTGPVARDDQATLLWHRRAIAAKAPELSALTDQLVAETRALITDAEPRR